MKIADPESIKAGEQELINSIMGKLNSEIIESIASGKLVIDNMEFRNGDMMIYKNRIVYKMDFQTSVAISVMFDREGNLITEDEDAPLDFAEEEIENTEEEQIDNAFDNEDGFDEEEILNPVLDEEKENKREFDLVLEKTRNFWLQKISENIESVNMSEPDVKDHEFLSVLQKNRDFWQEQALAGE